MQKSSKIIILSIAIIELSIILLVVYLNKNNLDLRPVAFEWMQISFFMVIEIIVLVLCFVKKKYIRYMLLFILLGAFIINKIRYVNIKDDVVIEDNVKLVKVKNNSSTSFDYYKYINKFVMSEDKLKENNYYDYNFKSKDFCENDSAHIIYYNKDMEKYEDSEIEVISKNTYNFSKEMSNRVALLIMNEEELKSFNNTIYDISKNENVDFSNQILVAITYSADEIVPFYLGKLNNDLNLVIQNKKENKFSELMILKIPKDKFENIRISDFDTYINPI